MKKIRLSMNVFAYGQKIKIKFPALILLLDVREHFEIFGENWTAKEGFQFQIWLMLGFSIFPMHHLFRQESYGTRTWAKRIFSWERPLLRSETKFFIDIKKARLLYWNYFPFKHLSARIYKTIKNYLFFSYRFGW